MRRCPGGFGTRRVTGGIGVDAGNERVGVRTWWGGARRTVGWGRKCILGRVQCPSSRVNGSRLVRIFMLALVLGGTARGVACAQEYAGRQPYRIATDEDGAHAALGHEPTYDPQGEYRQPTSLTFIEPALALITTKLTGEIYQFDLQDRSLDSVVSAPGRHFHRGIQLGDGRIAVADIRNDEILVYGRGWGSEGWNELARVALRGRPNSLCYDSATSRLWVSSVWGQRLFCFHVGTETEPALEAIRSVDLPMCGGQVLFLREPGLVMVTDAFGCEFVMIDPSDGAIVNHDRLYEHNIAELVALDDGKEVLFPQQLLVDLVAAVQSQITWGNFLSNNLRMIPAKRLMESSGADIYTDSRFIPVGSFGNGAADPNSLAMTRDGKLAVSIGGTNQVALGTLDGSGFQFVRVGKHPVDCEFTPDGKTLVVVNQFSDSLSIIEVDSLEVEHVPLGGLRPPTDVERGEQLFHDASLSHDGWMSCQSCHSSGHTNGLLSDNFTDDSYQSPKRVLSLLGQAETAPYSWSGSMETLEEQIAFSIESTMASDDPVRQRDVDQLAQYVRTLDRPPSLTEARVGSPVSSTLADQIERGREFFAAAGCADCHPGPHYTSRGTYDVGLSDERAMREFNPPSLIAVSQRQSSLFHDGRARSIRDVVFGEQHQLSEAATDQQREDLVQFLLSL